MYTHNKFFLLHATAALLLFVMQQLCPPSSDKKLKLREPGSACVPFVFAGQAACCYYDSFRGHRAPLLSIGSMIILRSILVLRVHAASLFFFKGWCGGVGAQVGGDVIIIIS